MLPIFAAAIVGGIGNPFGAFLGGYVIAFSENIYNVRLQEIFYVCSSRQVWSLIR